MLYFIIVCITAIR